MAAETGLFLELTSGKLNSSKLDLRAEYIIIDKVTKKER
jgi:hypothetical protein